MLLLDYNEVEMIYILNYYHIYFCRIVQDLHLDVKINQKHKSFILLCFPGFYFFENFNKKKDFPSETTQDVTPYSPPPPFGCASSAPVNPQDPDNLS